ncbi:MAG: 4-(cytidine 5'-diphospho)-2-C-methyl-D-erythritol kinase [Planctomycetes bacterium]|nr:4-(cytidine 5'-diphospho)-2-C-methyl-D-erythritol kinase [Planctomycetota bacterium]
MPTALAPGKLNLYLEVVGRRPDGYHELRTLFQTVRWGDDVTVERTAARGVACRTVGADVPDDERNLAVRAASRWLEASGAGGGVAIRLDKRVPVGGGLGGGSSDAATVLRLLDEGAGPAGLGPDRLHALARGLGADVPFLLEGGTATATGVGDRLERRRSGPPVRVVLVLPPFGTETARVYARVAERLRKAPAGGLERAVDALVSGVPAAIRDAHHNDLAEAALRAYPELLRFTAEVERALGRPPAMTGSGSTLFDVPDPGEEADVLARLAALPGRREVVVTG